MAISDPSRSRHRADMPPEPSGEPTIGLLAGMGVRSTAPFLTLVVEECQRLYGATHQPDFPQMIVFSWPIPFWTDRPVDHDALRRRIAQGLKWLERTGVDFLAMPANLPHLYFRELEREVDIPLLNLVDAAVGALAPDAGPVAVLATRPVRDSGMYQRAVGSLDIEALADDEIQDAVDELLRALWAGAPVPRLQERWQGLLRDAAARGARSALLACTDLNAVANPDAGVVPVIDATRLMARKVVATWHALATERGVRPAPSGG